jgi:hypothetical protein
MNMRGNVVVIGSMAGLLAACAHHAPREQGAGANKPLQATARNSADAQLAGYIVKNENGRRPHCRRDLTTGSHLAHTTTCLTEQE